ncbi:FAD-binding oxidoreductase [Palleronia sediminis]|uniref:FAD-binding oxidoreductase n=1 Tax=Palleronia sediminis TaxID=2547833 RepID=A0A4R6A0Y8_9RHOB|nr:FAD-dependent oxidoreductase [Palleronia sediminis]TDL76057.1 FAD-binding oxidoreductase [Palleronia sediminis]
MASTQDVTILGAGIIGLSIAWACRARDATVTVIEPCGPGAGASGGLVGALAPHVPEAWNEKKAFQLDSLLAARGFWADVAEATPCDPGYTATGRLQPLAEDAAVRLAHARSVTARDLWQGRAEWIVTDAPGPFAPRAPTGLYVRDTLSAHLHPRRAVTALADALRRRGAAIEAEGQPRGPVIHATGAAGLDLLSESFGRPVGQGIKGQAALLGHDARGAAQVFVDGLHIVPHADGTTAIGSTTERAFDAPTTTDAQLDEVIARARAALPALADAPVLERWAGLRPRARSRAPILGAWPGREGHFIANGGFKIGFGMAPGIADVMADLVLEGRDRIPAPFRFDPGG